MTALYPFHSHFGIRLLVACLCTLPSAYAAEVDAQLAATIHDLQIQTEQLAKELQTLKMHKPYHPPKRPVTKHTPPGAKTPTAPRHPMPVGQEPYHSSKVSVHVPDKNPESLEFYPTVLMADNQVVTYISGTPVISAPYLGARPAFDGSDYIVNISSINRDIRLMQQRRNLYRSYQAIGYPSPDIPVIALSGKIEPVVSAGSTYVSPLTGDLTLGSDELDVAAVITDNMEAYMGIAYNSSPPAVGGQRVANSAFSLNMGFVNIGNLDKTPFYATVGQIYVPFGRYNSAMVSPTLPMLLSRTKSRPLILGYKSQDITGPLLSVYAFKSDTTNGQSGAGGLNWAYIFAVPKGSGEIGVSLISSVNDATGIQYTGSIPGTTFGGFASVTNGNENTRKTPALDAHMNMSVDRYNFMFEWVGVTKRFRPQDLSFNGEGAKPQALQAELGVTFRAFDKPASLGAGYQWSSQTLALNLPEHRINGVFNISIWKDTIESLEYRHDIDYKTTQYANGANAPTFPANQNTVGTGACADTVIAQIGVFF